MDEPDSPSNRRIPYSIIVLPIVLSVLMLGIVAYDRSEVKRGRDWAFASCVDAGRPTVECEARVDTRSEHCLVVATPTHGPTDWPHFRRCVLDQDGGI